MFCAIWWFEVAETGWYVGNALHFDAYPYSIQFDFWRYNYIYIFKWQFMPSLAK